MKFTDNRTLTKSCQVYITKKIRESLEFPVGCLLEIHATDETEDGKPVIMIRKVEEKVGK